MNIPVGDWVDEYRREEPNLSTEEDAIAGFLEGNHTIAEWGRILAIAKMFGETFERVPTPKPMVNTGYSRWWSSSVVESLREQVDLENGRTVEVRALSGPVLEPNGDEAEGDGDKSYVSWDDKQAIDRAVRYVLDVVPGHIYNRFKLLAANGEDVRGVANDLQDKIDELVERLA